MSWPTISRYWLQSGVVVLAIIALTLGYAVATHDVGRLQEPQCSIESFVVTPPSFSAYAVDYDVSSAAAQRLGSIVADVLSRAGLVEQSGRREVQSNDDPVLSVQVSVQEAATEGASDWQVRAFSVADGYAKVELWKVRSLKPVDVLSDEGDCAASLTSALAMVLPSVSGRFDVLPATHR